MLTGFLLSSEFVFSFRIFPIVKLGQFPVNFFFFNIYLLLRDRETQSVSRGGVEKGGDTESEAGSRLRAVSTAPDAGLKFTNCKIMT